MYLQGSTSWAVKDRSNEAVGWWVGPYAAQAVIAGQVAEVRTSLAVVAPWLWLIKMELAELPRTELARAELV